MSVERALALLEELEGLDYPERIQPAEEAVRLADQARDDELAYTARFELLTASVFGGAPEKALVAFAWLESRSTQDPERFPFSRAGSYLTSTDVLWAYKWIGLNLLLFAEISRAQIESVLERMRTQYERHGISLRPYWMTRSRMHVALGDGEQDVLRSYEAFEAAPRDMYADCRACEVNYLVETALHRGDFDLAMLHATPVLQGRLKCAEVPHITLSTLVVPSWDAGMHDLARQLHQRGYDLCRGNKDFLAQIAEHIDFRLLDGDWAGAKELVERHFAWTVGARVGSRELRFLQSALAVASTAPSGARFEIHHGIGPADAAAWIHSLEASVKDAAARFDLRNQNRWVSSQIDRHQARFR